MLESGDAAGGSLWVAQTAYVWLAFDDSERTMRSGTGTSLILSPEVKLVTDSGSRYGRSVVADVVCQGGRKERQECRTGAPCDVLSVGNGPKSIKTIGGESGFFRLARLGY